MTCWSPPDCRSDRTLSRLVGARHPKSDPVMATRVRKDYLRWSVNYTESHYSGMAKILRFLGNLAKRTGVTQNSLFRDAGKSLAATVLPDETIITVGNKSQMVVNPHIDGMHYYFGYDDREPGIYRLMRTYLEGGMTFVDVGAHIGYYSLIAWEIVGTTGTVVAFEADPLNAARTRENVDLNDAAITVEQLAVSDTEGQTQLFSGDRPTTHSIVESEADVTDSVETTSLDAYFEDCEPPDMVKIDVEGAEGKVLAGMDQVLSAQPAIILELHPRQLQDTGYSTDDLLEKLQGMGYQLHLVGADGGTRTLRGSDVGKKTTEYGDERNPIVYAKRSDG